MHLKQIKIAGFKSFADPQDLTVMTGLTGIVGPNGCGKSNLLESLRWVMGASSAKAMRGQAMDDLIFSGSGQRASRELAEVNLILDNTSRTAPPAYNDADSVEIIRRIKRGAGSSFTVNGVPARAKDIRLIFADASTGANSPSLVRQGQISELIAARPENRRRILEEAAGIAGLNTRRHEAELKLKSAETNLNRCQDIESELTRQLSSLKRQAAKAEKYRLLTEEMHALALYIAAQSWQNHAQNAASSQAALDAARRAAQEAEQVEIRAETQRLEKSQALVPLRQSASVAGAKLGQIRIEHAKIETQLNASTDAQAAQKREEVRLREDLATLTDQIEEFTKQNTELTAWLANNPPVDEGAFQARISALRDDKRNIEDQIFDAETDINILRDKLAKIKAERAAFEAQINAAKIRYENARHQVQAVRSEQSTLPNLVDKQGDVAKAAKALSNTQAQLAQLEVACANHAQTYDIAQQANVQASTTLSEAHAQLKGVLAEQRAISDVLRASTQAYKAPMLNDVRVDAGLELAVASLLGDDLQGSIDTEQPLHWRQTDAETLSLPDEVDALAGWVQAPPQLSRRLSQCGLVADVPTGERLSKTLKQGQRLVTREGHMWRWDGLTRFPNAPEKSAETLRLVRRKQEIDRAVQSAQAAYDRCKDAADSALNNLAEVKQDKARHDTKLAQLKSDVIQSRSDLDQAKLVGESLQAKHDLIASKLHGVMSEFTEAEAACKQVESLSRTENLQDIQPKIDALLESLKSLRQDVRAAEIKETDCVREFATLSDQISKNRQLADKTEIRLESAKSRLARTQKDLAAVREKIALFDNTPEELQRRFSVLTGQIQSLELERRAANDALARAEAAYADAATEAKTSAAGAVTSREASTKAEVIYEAAFNTLSDISRQIEVSFGVAPKDINLPELKDIATQFEWPQNIDNLKAHEIGLRDTRERLGGVNMDAAQEAETLSSRAATQAAERADLEDAIAKLRLAIKELNDKGRAKLNVAYETVNTHFKKLFTRLFGGGQAELKLVNADDPLASGLEIYAQPPGKKLATLALMSGGEQALTATALIFAVFLSQPSPICVLDEVDAPLDDANVTRFCDLLDSMRQETETRFIVITHNPVTMSRMDRLFGVTMREKGVSRLVSVDLQTANQMVA